MWRFDPKYIFCDTKLCRIHCFECVLFRVFVERIVLCSVPILNNERILYKCVIEFELNNIIFFAVFNINFDINQTTNTIG